MNGLVQMLTSVDMMQYHYTLTANGVNNVEDCWKLTDADLKRMGMEKVVHRRKLLRAAEHTIPPVMLNNGVLVVCVQFKWGRVGTYRVPGNMDIAVLRTGVPVVVEDVYEGTKGSDLGIVAGQVLEPSVEQLACPFLLRVAGQEELAQWAVQNSSTEKQICEMIFLLPEAAGIPLKRCEYRFDMKLVSLHITAMLLPRYNAIFSNLFPTTQIRLIYTPPHIDTSNEESLKYYTQQQPMQPVITRGPVVVSDMASSSECGLSMSSEDGVELVQ
eukprot:TRINITY_DN1135_c0_g1_i3.p1 TRINITY_DN1135_c0_g1~~TRINITY_DN1135_c0_g1_i3.p1  ORF type:complete len:294 (+),score=65.31 TRINITY_DN1135_c0_g1_i3:67-882(+)